MEEEGQVQVEMTETNKLPDKEEEGESHRNNSSRVCEGGDGGRSAARRRKRTSARIGALVLRNKNGFKKFIRGASITSKITISFLQVM